ncbi:uncharacterized protein LOC113391166 [Ctenocephalides felis]|uniref:uncharacterized protein LOC113391166 n=1 Tax=Ctenocephalides felis TaxID=7515 RepID=UPI000E6E439C|nr:uncharacterized protein LOC113391166 [Ctenocephalides felis]
MSPNEDNQCFETEKQDSMDAFGKQNQDYYRVDKISYDFQRNFGIEDDREVNTRNNNKSISSPSIPPKTRLAMKLQYIFGLNDIENEGEDSLEHSSSLVKFTTISPSKMKKKNKKKNARKVISIIAPPKEISPANTTDNSVSDTSVNQGCYGIYPGKSRCSSFFLHPQAITSSVSLFLKNEAFFQKLCSQYSEGSSYCGNDSQIWKYAMSSSVGSVRSYVALRQAEGKLAFDCRPSKF